MIPAAFDYRRPGTLQEAVALLAQNEDAKVLAGGHSLIPAMKLRLAQPGTVVDIGGIKDLSYIREQDGHVVIGAMTTHFAIESSALLREKCPLLTELAPRIGDVQVRNRGTFGGSLVHADPASDWPAAVLALEAEFDIAGPGGHRTVKATDFFVEMMQSAVQSNEILCAIRLPVTGPTVAYVKTAQKASGFAIAGAAVWLRPEQQLVTIGITGVAPKPYRASAVEKLLNGKQLTPDAIRGATMRVIEEIEPLNDIHASNEFRAHLAAVNCRRALELAASRA
jgi:carbon-monoxide dehydrogenase medium subunit